MLRPTYLNHSPQPEFIGILLDAPIFFRIFDSDGLNLSSFTVKIEGVEAILNGEFQAGFNGAITKEDHIPTAISVVIVRDEPFNYSQIVNVNSIIEDMNGLSSKNSYQFVTIPNPDVKNPIVTASPHGAFFNKSLEVELLCDESDVTIYYTLNGTIPTLSSSVYSQPIQIFREGRTQVKFFAMDNAYNCSPIITENYQINTSIPQTHAIPSSGNFFDSQEISLECNDPKAKIYYTVNGLEPTISSDVYSTPIKLRDNKQTTLKFFAVNSFGSAEEIKTEVYKIEIAKNNFIPTNVFVTCPFNRNELHISWDDMHPHFNEVVGYNIYRAHTEMGPYEKLNSSIVSITQFQDRTLDSVIINEDVSEQFRRTVNISRDVNDNFEGSGSFDPLKWKEIDPGELLFKHNALIFKDATGLKGTSKLVSNFKLRGDFEIIVDFSLIEWIPPNLGTQSCRFIVKKNDSDYIEVSRDRSRLLDLYCSRQFVNGNPDLPETKSSTEDIGKFKIIRKGEIVTTYFYDKVNENFVQIGIFDRYTEDLYVELCGHSEDKRMEVRFEDFKVLSGNPIIIEPLNPQKEYTIYLEKNPIVDDTGLNQPTDDPKFVNVTINGERAYIRSLRGYEGLIYLETDRMYDEVKKEYFIPPVPNEFSTVLVSYRVPLKSTNIGLRKNYFYKVTCVTAEDETDLDVITPEYLKPEKITYIYEEAVKRNAWLLDQAGERVLLYIKKRAGQKCHCTYRDLKERTHKQPDQNCETCFGSGFIGGFDGPYPIIIAPLTTEKSIQQTDRGLKLMYQIETWTGPTPLISQRDLIMRRNGDRCLVGPLTPVEGPGGVMVQQHFVIEILDGTDIRYKFNVHPLPNQKQQPGIDKTSKHVLRDTPNVATIDSPKEREELRTSEDRVSHENKNVDHIVKGRSINFENKLYGLIPFGLGLIEVITKIVNGNMFL